ncbi:MAG: T9SS type A sorting domain-containing protein [Bacteroidia bacterium]
MKKITTCLLVLLFMSFNALNAQQYVDVMTAGASGNDYATSIQTDASNNRFVAGMFSGSVQFGSTTLTSYGGLDIFVAKISPAGAYLWVRQIGGSGDELVSDLQLDQSGNCYLAGYYTGSAVMYSPTQSYNFVNDDGLKDFFAAKYTASGTAETAEIGNLSQPSEATAIAISSDNRVYICGSIDFGNDRDAFVLMTQFNGHSNTWFSTTASFDDEIATDLVVDNNGVVHVGGSFAGSIQITSTSSTYNADGDFSGYIAAYSSTGSFLQGFVYDGNSTGSGANVTDLHFANGRVYALGRYGGTVDLATGVAITSLGTLNTFITELNYNSSSSTYGLVSHKEIRGAGTVFGRNLFVKGNNMYVSGNFDNSLVAGSQTLNTSGMQDGFLMAYKNNNFDYSLLVEGSTNNQFGLGVVEDATGKVFQVGGFSATSNFDNITKNAAGQLDIFIAEITTTSGPQIALSYASTGVCAGSEIAVSVTATSSLDAGNQYSFELSDASGSFASPTSLGQFAGTTDLNEVLQLPFALAAGSGYKIRVNSSAPVLSDEGPAFAVYTAPAVKTIVGATTVASLDPIQYSVSQTTGSSFEWIITNGSQISGGNSNVVEVAWSDQHTSGSIRVVETNDNNCEGDTARLNVTIEDGVGIVQNQQDLKIRLFPNPATDFVQIEIPNTGGTMYQATLRDLQGRELTGKILRNDEESAKGEISLANFAEGIYILEIRDGQKVSSYRIVRTGK